MSTVTVVLGLVASILITIAYVPQTIHTIKTKHTKGLSMQWLVTLIAGSMVYAAYGIEISSLPLFLSSVAGVIMVSIILYHKLKYK